MRTSAIFGVKAPDFSKIYGVSAWTKGGGVEPLRTFCGQRGGVNFSRFCADALYGRPLIANIF